MEYYILGLIIVCGAIYKSHKNKLDFKLEKLEIETENIQFPVQVIKPVPCTYYPAIEYEPQSPFNENGIRTTIITPKNNISEGEVMGEFLHTGQIVKIDEQSYGIVDKNRIVKIKQTDPLGIVQSSNKVLEEASVTINKATETIKETELALDKMREKRKERQLLIATTEEDVRNNYRDDYKHWLDSNCRNVSDNVKINIRGHEISLPSVSKKEKPLPTIDLKKERQDIIEHKKLTFRDKIENLKAEYGDELHTIDVGSTFQITQHTEDKFNILLATKLEQWKNIEVSEVQDLIQVTPFKVDEFKPYKDKKGKDINCITHYIISSDVNGIMRLYYIL